MTGAKILLVEDSPTQALAVRSILESRGHEVVVASDGEEGLKLFRASQPDLVILDVLLPKKDGLEVCRRLKSDALTAAIAIVMLTAKGEDADIVAGLELGADDYITKPFSPRVLLARIRAVLRREHRDSRDTPKVMRSGGLVINPATREVSSGDVPVPLTTSEFNILSFLVRRPGWVFTRSQIINAVRGEDYPVTERSIDVQIVGLRKKLGEAGKHVQTVRGIGYRFKE